MLKKNLWLLIFAISFFHLSAIAAYKPTFVPSPCQVKYDYSGEIVCGYVEVPLSYSDPSRLIKLDLAILKAKDANQKKPILFLEGGPGGNGMIPHNKNIYKFTEHRDLILLSQRGTGFSEASQECDMDIFAAPLLEALKICKKNLQDEGVDFSAYTIRNSAEDVKNVISALGDWSSNYKQVNLFGVSYGTLLALQVMRYYPDKLNSVILDSTLAPQAHFLEEGGTNGAAAINHLINKCNSSYVCHTNYPNLENDFFTLAERINKEPMTVIFPWNGKPLKRSITMENLMDAINNNYDGIPYLPNAIHLLAIQKNNFYETSEVDSIVSKVFPPETLAKHQFSFGNYWSVACESFLANENMNKVEFYNRKLPQVLQDFYKEYAQTELDGCKIWLGDIKPNLTIRNPVISSIPTIIFAGEYDGSTNGTPPKWGILAATTIKNSHFYIVPNVGHETLRAGACPLKIANEFYDDPNKEPDSECLNENKR